MKKNIRHLYADVAWYGILAGSTLAFLSIYAARLGASGFQIGLLTAGPALVNLLISLPAGRWIERRALIPTSFWSSGFQRLGYVLLIILPWLLDLEGQVNALVLVVLLMAFPATLLAIGFNALLAEVVPLDLRAEVVGKRNALMAISMTASTLLSGYLLDQITFPLNYQVVFVLGGIGALMSTYHIGRLQPVQSQSPSSLQSNGFSVPASLVQFRNALQKLEKLPFGGGAALRSLAHFELLRGKLGLFMAAYLLFYAFMYLGVPIFPLVTVDVLNLSDGVISLGSGIFYAAMFLISLRLQKLAVRFGHHTLLAASAILMGTYPLIMGFASGPYHYWLASLLGGLVYGLVSASLLNRLMEVVPEGQRAGGMSFHNLALNLGILAGSLAGPGLADWLGLQDSMFAVAGLRLIAGLLMVFWA